MEIKYIYYKLRAYYNIIGKDLKDKHPLSLLKKIKMWRHGFLAEKYVLYQLDKYPLKSFLSDYHTSISRWINEPFNELLTNKYLFAEIIGKYIKVPETYGYISKGSYYPKNNIILEELLNKVSAFVIKPVDGGGGKGVIIIRKESENYLLNETETRDKRGLIELFASKDKYLVTEYIEQGMFQKSLNPNSVNTMRVLTLFDPETNCPFIAQAVQRVGVKKSQPQDNFTKGGISFNINLDTGELSDGTEHPKTNVHVRHSVHPDSKKQIQGLVIPNWESIKQQINHLIINLPMLKCVGWDFLMTDSGLVAIEGNHHPDPDVLQGHSALLTNKKVHNFYKFHHII